MEARLSGVQYDPVKSAQVDILENCSLGKKHYKWAEMYILQYKPLAIVLFPQGVAAFHDKSML